MNGNVFQLATERKKRDQFEDTLEALKIYASTKFSDDITYLDPLFKRLKEPMVNVPVKPGPVTIQNDDGTTTLQSPDSVDLDIYKERMKKYDKKIERLQGTIRSLYNVVWAQTSDLLRNQLQELNDFDTIEDNGDVTTLLKEIKKSCHDIENRVYPYDSVDEVQRQFFTYRQAPEENNAVHLKKFKTYIELLDHYGVTMFEDKFLIEYEIKKNSSKPVSDIKKEVRNKKLAICFIRRAKLKVCSPVLDMLRDAFLTNQDIYPKNLEKAYALIQNHSSSKKKSVPNENGQSNSNRNGRTNSAGRNNNSTVTGQSFFQQMPAGEKPAKGADGKTNKNAKCYKCRKWGHYADNCPSSANANNEQNMQEAEYTKKDVSDEDNEESDPELTDEERNDPKVSFQHMLLATQNMANEQEIRKIDVDSILLDTGSNISVFNNKSLLKNVRDGPHIQRVYTNGGHQDSTHMGHLPGFFDVWYNLHSRLNILSFAEVAQKFRITMDTAHDSAICVHIAKSESRSKMDFMF